VATSGVATSGVATSGVATSGVATREAVPRSAAHVSTVRRLSAARLCREGAYRRTVAALREVYPGDDHTVSGDVHVLPGVASHGLARRDILVYLPPSYGARPARRYPVLYLGDGQNVFDAATSFAGEWGVDEAAENLAAGGQGPEVILVAIPNGGDARLAEYDPWPAPAGLPIAGQESQAAAYLDFVLQTVRPRVDRAFRTRTGRGSTGIVGSSLGGLIALYACLTRPNVFGFCGALSPAFWVTGGKIFAAAEERSAAGLRVYLDVGRREAGGRMVPQIRRMRDVLRRRGYDVAYVEDADGEHNEEAWRRRFPAMLAWFLDPAARPPGDGNDETA